MLAVMVTKTCNGDVVDGGENDRDDDDGRRR